MSYRLHPQTRLRAESQGALWFHRHTAETLELDLEGLDTLLRLLQGKRLWSPRGWRFFQYLWAKGFLQKQAASPEEVAQLQTLREDSRHLQSPLRSRQSPEVLHLSLTDACQQSCSGCFFSNPDPHTPNRYMSPKTFQKVLKEAVKHQVFQMALGGGEPLMHPKLLDYVAAITQAGMVANLTSNGALLTRAKAQALKAAGLGQIQFSLNGHNAELHAQTRPHHDKVLQAIATAQTAQLRWGLNILVTPAHLQHGAAALHELFTFAQSQGAAMVNLIRPKAAQNDPQWLQNHQPDATGHRQLQKLLTQWQRKAQFALMTDTSYTFLREGSAAQWAAAGVSGCSAGRRMMSVQVDGRYSPCSHLPEAFQSPGDLQKVWQSAPAVTAFRQLEETLEGECHRCELKSVCRGCRAVVLSEGRSFFGADHQCPKPLSTSS